MDLNHLITSNLPLSTSKGSDCCTNGTFVDSDNERYIEQKLLR